MNAAKSAPKASDELSLSPDQLCPGLFVKLKLGWMDHPFVFNQFRIANQEQVEQIKALGQASVAYVPSRSISEPLPLPEHGLVGASPGVASAVSLDRGDSEVDAKTQWPPPGWESSVVEASSTPDPTGASPAAVNPLKIAQAKRIAAVRARIERCERGYVKAASQVRIAMQGLHSSSERAIQAARGVVDGLVESFSDDAEMVLHLMNEKLADETAYFHVLNVMVLSLMLGRELRLPPEVLRVLGEGALFHDIGKLRVPDSVLRNPKRNRHEEEFYRLHTAYGRQMAREIPGFPAVVGDIIEFHHETCDGKGFPKGLKQDAIPMLARIVAIANRYDNLCNPLVRAEGVTPAEALSFMFRNESARWDKEMLHRFVRMMGVYPPGSLVQLSNGNVGIVLAVDHGDLLRPSVMVFDPDVPRSEAIVIDLSEEREVKIDLALRPSDLNVDATEYLSPKRRMSYFQSNRGGA